MPKGPSLIALDGRVGEGGGQLVRLAVCLAAITTQDLRITNVRGNRKGSRAGDSQGGGLKSQHVTAIQWLVHATNAEVEGLSVGSHTLTFRPRTSPAVLAERKIRIAADQSAASTLLILQAILPFLLFARGERNEPLEVEIQGGTNVSFSLSYEYLDQVVLPALQERFGIVVERELVRRGWSQGPNTSQGGLIRVKVQPLGLGEKLRFIEPSWRARANGDGSGGPRRDQREVKTVDVTMLVPQASHETLQRALVRDLLASLGHAEVRFHTVEDSGHDSRWYVLLVASSASGVRWGVDTLTSLSKRARSRDAFITTLSRSLCRDLVKEVELGGEVDDHLQDQLVVFQALADGISAFEKEEGDGDFAAAIEEVKGWDDRNRIINRMKVDEPAGNGALHARTVRWVAGEMLPKAKFFRKGDIVDGAGICIA